MDQASTIGYKLGYDPFIIITDRKEIARMMLGFVPVTGTIQTQVKRAGCQTNRDLTLKEISKDICNCYPLMIVIY